MTHITVAGAGAFGTALAIALSVDGRKTTLWARSDTTAQTIDHSRENAKYLPEMRLPDSLTVRSSQRDLAAANIALLAIPTQNLRSFLKQHGQTLATATCVVCCKGIETNTGLLPSQIVNDVLPNTNVAVLTGPGFAAEIARGLPTALTLAADWDASDLQNELSTQSLRLYLSTDPIGAQLGGALKNVIAIACGIASGAGLGESARAALMTRGYAEMLRLAVDMGGNAETLAGLSGLGDLALSCASTQSRNFSLGFDLGRGEARQSGTTFEGVATATATLILARDRKIDMPVAHIVAAVLARDLTITQAVSKLLSRPLKLES